MFVKHGTKRGAAEFSCVKSSPRNGPILILSDWTEGGRSKSGPGGVGPKPTLIYQSGPGGVGPKFT
jgi:hypothetical protein